jgi:methylenetetrahydrofolate dehydrogenase (NADP+)/methenyltetrahydrofolate cyclohydrolase
MTKERCKSATLVIVKLLSGTELVGYIKERQARQVRGLRQQWKVFPRLAIIVVGDNPVIDTYVRLKQAYGEDILVDVEVIRISQAEVLKRIEKLNDDEAVHGIIVQLPLPDPAETDVIVNSIAPEKDVDGLGKSAHYTSATATAIDWLLTGYNVTLDGKEIVLVGHGRLVGAPLAKLWHNKKLTVVDDTTRDIQSHIKSADIVVTATGVPGLIKSDMVKNKAVIVDAGTASEDGKIVGDVAPELRERDDITITPEKGGVGPLTIAVLLDNVITASRKVAQD